MLQSWAIDGKDKAEINATCEAEASMVAYPFLDDHVFPVTGQQMS